MPGRTGRTPLPTHLKLLKGETRPSRLNAREPRPRLGAKSPAWLSPSARTEWNRLAPDLEACGVLTRVDADCLAIYCVMLVNVRDALESGQGVEPRAMGEWRQWAMQQGLTPASRGRVQAVEPSKGGQLARYLPDAHDRPGA